MSSQAQSDENRSDRYPFDLADEEGWNHPARLESVARADRRALLNEQVHLWRATWPELAPRLDEFRSILSEAECKRADRYLTDTLTEQSVLTHGWLRTLLADYLDLHPQHLRFEYGEHGKPSLEDRPIDFNVSHSAETVVVAVTAELEFGVDIEYEKTDRDLASLARRYFSEDEVRRFDGLSEAEQPPAFYRTWTRKEAYLKALGGGLTLPLDRFAVTLEPDRPPSVLWSDLDPEDHPGWWLGSFRAAKDVAGAVILPGGERALRFFGYESNRSAQ